MKKIFEFKREEFMKKAAGFIEPSHILLDIGCGIRPHAYIHHDVYVACEPFDEYVDVLKRDRENLASAVYIDSSFIILNEDWQSFLDKYENYSVDTVYLIDVIEHLPKEEGIKLLARTEKIARKQIVIFTPLEYIEQKKLPGNKDAWGLNGGDWQEHKSVWTPEDFVGDDWFFIICKDFHEYNNIGELLEKPVGAFWAIKKIKEFIYKDNILDNRFVKDLYHKSVAESLVKKEELLDNIRENLEKVSELNQLIIDKEYIIQQKDSVIKQITSTKGYRILEIYRRLRDKLKR